MEDANVDRRTTIGDDDRMEAEYDFVIGRVAQRDVVVDGEVVVPAGKEVTGADATAALSAGVLEELAFAVGMGDVSQTEYALDTEAVSETWDNATEPGPADAVGAVSDEDTDVPVYEPPARTPLGEEPTPITDPAYDIPPPPVPEKDPLAPPPVVPPLETGMVPPTPGAGMTGAPGPEEDSKTR